MLKKSFNRFLCRRITGEEGFTLLEVIVTISILTSGLLALGTMQLTSIKGNFFACRITEGSALASDRMEKLLALPYTDSDLAPGIHTDPSPPAGRTITWNITDNSPLNNTKTVDLTVSWIDRGAQKNLSMQRIISKTL